MASDPDTLVCHRITRGKKKKPGGFSVCSRLSVVNGLLKSIDNNRER